jgi:hypothetical protein
MAGFTSVVLTGKYTDGLNPMAGTITITLSQVMSNTDLTVIPNSKVIVLDSNGAFSETFLANTDGTTVPQGTFYQVTEELYGTVGTVGASGASGASGGSISSLSQGQQRDYSIQIPALDSSGNPVRTVDISSLMPGTPMGFSPTGNPAGSVQWTTFLDMPEVLSWLQFTSGIATPGTEISGLLQRIIDAACWTGQDIANRPLCPTQMFNRYSGWSGEYIQLDYSPIIKIVKCQEWMSTGGFVQLPESTPENPVEGVQVNYRTGQIMRTFAGYSWPRPFFPGSRNIEVTYIAGYDPIPPNVWVATIDLVAYWFRNTYQASRTFTGNAAEYGQNQQASGDLWPGIPNRIAQVFESFRLPVIG